MLFLYLSDHLCVLFFIYTLSINKYNIKQKILYLLMTTECGNCQKIVLIEKMFHCELCNRETDAAHNQCSDDCFVCELRGCEECVQIVCGDCSVPMCEECRDSDALCGRCHDCRFGDSDCNPNYESEASLWEATSKAEAPLRGAMSEAEDEVTILKNKIIELESEIARLKDENARLLNIRNEPKKEIPEYFGL